MLEKRTITAESSFVLLPLIAMSFVSGTIPDKESSYKDFLYRDNSYKVYFEAIDDMSHWNNDTSIYFYMGSNNLLLQRSIKNLIACINEEPVSPGMETSYFDYFSYLRNDINYATMFYILTNDYSDKIKQSFINLLSMIPHNDVFPFEELFILEQFSSENLLSQEYALNTISVWNDIELFNEVKQFKLKSPILQKRLNKILQGLK